MSDLKSNELFEQYQAGQTEAAAAIYDRYIQRLMALVRTRIGPKLKRRVDPEDVVQSAYRSFFVHAKNQEHQLARSGDLWRLLARTTLNKLYGQIERQTAEKRTVNREVTGEAALDDLRTREPTVVEVVAMGEQLRLAIDGLSTDERLVLTSTLQGQSVEEVSRSVGKSERTIRRLLKQAKQQFEAHLLQGRIQRNVGSAPRMAEPEAPLKFSDYVLEQLLGSGGMGKVYRATDKRTGKSVAIKALRKSRQSDERAVRQFVQESQILARLRHPNIVNVQGLGRFPAGGYFIVMDFVDGVDLQSRLQTGPLSVAEAISIVKHVAGAVQHAHDHAIVHCDLKPANILVDSRNHVFVTDFGFAFVFSNVSQASMNSIGGTEGYIPPEILQLQSQPTCATDIFALGALLWTLTTGKVPCERDTGPTPGYSDSSIEAICQRCLANNPKERYPTVSDLVNDLSSLPKSTERFDSGNT